MRDVAKALKRVLPTERVCVLSPGSSAGNSHLNWHVAPLPPGVPYGERQYHALMMEHGVLDLARSIFIALAEVRD